jgi:hypothetical protein
MNHRGIEYTLTMTTVPGVWKWQFRIGDEVKTGKTETRIDLLAIRRVQFAHRPRAQEGPTFAAPAFDVVYFLNMAFFVKPVAVHRGVVSDVLSAGISRTACTPAQRAVLQEHPPLTAKPVASVFEANLDLPQYAARATR